MTRGKWMESTLRSDRDKRCLSRAWTRRKEKLAKQYTARTFHLVRRISTLKADVQVDAKLVLRLRKPLLGEITEVLHADDGCAVGEGGGGDAEVGAHPPGADKLPPEVSATQRNRLYNQAMAVMEVLQQQRDRDLLRLIELESAKRAVDDPTATTTSAAQQALQANVFKHMDEASLIRLRFSLLENTESFACVAGVKCKPRTILAWVRGFRKLGGYLKRDGRGVYETACICARKIWCSSC